MRWVVLLFFLVLFSNGWCTTYTHDVSSSEGFFFNQAPVLVKGYEYYSENNGSLTRIYGIPSDQETSCIYIKFSGTNLYELQFNSTIEGSSVDGYYITGSCSQPPCASSRITSNVITNSGLNVYFYNSYFTLSKNVEDCGDGDCDSSIGENCYSCPGDCACNSSYTCVQGECVYVPVYTCGDLVCEGWENCGNCLIDCPCEGCCYYDNCYDIVCGDGSCIYGCENHETCPDDCLPGVSYSPPYCGNNVCDYNETCSECPDDCGSCEQHSNINSVNHLCKEIFLSESSDVLLNVFFKKILDINNRFLTACVDCSEAENKSVKTTGCAKNSCVNGYCCNLGFGSEGVYKKIFENLGEGLHRFCVFNSAPEHYYWNAAISFKQAPESVCGNKKCDLSLNETCETCSADCGACISGAFTSKFFRINRTNSWIGNPENPTLVFNSERVEHVLINLTVKSNDNYYARSVVGLFNGERLVLIPLVMPENNINRVINVNSSFFSEGVNEIELYFTTSRDYSANSWIEAGITVFYTGKKPEEISQVSFQNVETGFVSLFNNSNSSLDEYRIAELIVPENTTLKSVNFTANVTNPYAGKAWIFVNGEKIILSNWIEPSESIILSCNSSKLKKGVNKVSVIVDSESGKAAASLEALLEYSGEKPYLRSVKNVDLNKDSLILPDELFLKDEVVLNDYDESKYNWKISNVMARLDGLKTEVQSLVNNTKKLSGNNSWDRIVWKIEALSDNLNKAYETAWMVKTESLNTNNMLLVKEELVKLMEGFQTLIDDVFRVINK